jgi:hypothetical protein
MLNDLHWHFGCGAASGASLSRKSPLCVRHKMKELPKSWSDRLVKQPESGMGYQIVTVTLRDGRKFEAAVTESHILGSVRGCTDIPFDVEEIVGIEVIPDWLLRREAQTWWTTT